MFIVAKGVHRTQPLVVLRCDLSQWEETKENQSREKEHEDVWGARCKLHRSFPSEVLESQVLTCCQPETAANIGGALPRVLFGAGHVGTLYLACTQISGSARKADVQHKPYCLHSLCLVRVLLVLGMGRGATQTQVPKCYPTANLKSKSFKREQEGLTLRHTPLALG